MNTPVFHGTELEAYELMEAIQHNCACVKDKADHVTQMCEPHAAMLHDQRFLDGLLYCRRIIECLMREEWR